MVSLCRTLPEFHLTYQCSLEDRDNSLSVEIAARPAFAQRELASLDSFYQSQFVAYLLLLNSSYVPRIAHEVTRGLRRAGYRKDLPVLARPRGPPSILPPYEDEELLFAPHGPWRWCATGDYTQQVTYARLTLPTKRPLDDLAATVARHLPGRENHQVAANDEQSRCDCPTRVGYTTDFQLHDREEC